MTETAGRSGRRHAGDGAAGWKRSPLLRRGMFVAAVLLVCFLWAMPIAGLAFALVERGVAYWWLILIFGLLMPVIAMAAVRGALIASGRGGEAPSSVEHGAAASSVPPHHASVASDTDPVAESSGAPTRSVIEPLSPREIEVLEQLAAGRSNREIAVALYVAPGTVKAHLNHIFRKLQATSRLQAVAHARQAGLLDALDRK
ncbi:helix-turn-helix transcriptional regulator [Glycomyces tenuis]|uniref:helix-turn-helix transcriptional regulator n=1 Tax=Glycomyces tenuis TaxID=58116 RepID=UPI0004208DEB|nr:response regulator transcription factor [Glycomyces tenuis]